MEDTAPNEIRGQVRNILGAFMFTGDDATKKISVLSGGERARVCLANLLLNPSNVLILDEPTNHLDLKAKDVLKEAIAKYPGTVIVVSHDRDFLIGMTNKVFEFNDGVVKEFVGDVNDFFEERRLANFREVEMNAPTTTESAQKKESSTPKSQNSNSNQDKQLKNKISKIESDIAVVELEISEIEAKISLLSEQGKYDNTLIHDLGLKKSKLEELMQDWESLQV